MITIKRILKASVGVYVLVALSSCQDNNLLQDELTLEEVIHGERNQLNSTPNLDDLPLPINSQKISDVLDIGNVSITENDDLRDMASNKVFTIQLGANKYDAELVTYDFFSTATEKVLRNKFILNNKDQVDSNLTVEVYTTIKTDLVTNKLIQVFAHLEYVAYDGQVIFDHHVDLGNPHNLQDVGYFYQSHYLLQDSIGLLSGTVDIELNSPTTGRSTINLNPQSYLLGYMHSAGSLTPIQRTIDWSFDYSLGHFEMKDDPTTTQM